MNFQEIVRRLDELLHDCRLDEAEQLLITGISEAVKNHDAEAEKYLLNEQIGFYRDCGRFPESLKAAEQAKLIFESCGDTESVSYATTLLNCANAYRAAGEYGEAFAAYNEVERIYRKLLPENDGRIASFYNNIALLYQETGQWDKSCSSLIRALELVRLQKDDARIAVSCSNLAVSLLRLDRTEEAVKLLTEADSILSGRSPSDFHYSAVLAGFGDAYYKLGQYGKAAEYYEQALSEIELHMGKNNFYDITSDNLAQTYCRLGAERPKLSGLELSRKFYTAFGEPMLKRNFSHILPKLAVGLAGEGSECLGYDDELSKDHDFGAGFCIWVPDDMPEETVTDLQNAYNLLPRSYFGIDRVEMKQAHGRVGVCRIGGFLNRLIGMGYVPETEREWLSVDETGLSAVCSGEIFCDHSGEITEIRQKLSRGYPEAVRLRRLAQQLGLMAQSGQYNYDRMRRRGDTATAQLYLAQFCESAMKAAHLCRRVYAPYRKWLLKSTSELDGFSDLAEDIRAVLINSASENINKICVKIAGEAVGRTMESNVYLGDTAEELAEKAAALERHDQLVNHIVLSEWQAFDKVRNIGGRAACQDDWETFSIMRGSQYRTWQTELLEKWADEFDSAYKSGRNLITEKYARMMESTDPERYAEIKDSLPEIPDDFIKIREAITGIQIAWMDEFAESYPRLASNARTIHTEDDSVFETSYETYLRGELSTYSSDMLYAYGRWIAELYDSGKNLAFMIMEETVRAYGYKSLDDAEK